MKSEFLIRKLHHAMKFFILIIICISCESDNQKGFPGFVELNSIKELRIQDSEIPSEYFLFEEHLTFPADSINKLVYQFWSQDPYSETLVLLSDTMLEKPDTAYTSSFQIWYSAIERPKNKIEVDIIICPGDEELDKTVTLFTKKLYSCVFKLDPSIRIGDNCWTADNYGNNDSFVLLFTKYNVFIRVYGYLYPKENNNAKIFIESIAKKIEDHIVKYQ